MNPGTVLVTMSNSRRIRPSLFQAPVGNAWHRDAVCARLPLELADHLFYPQKGHRIDSAVTRLCAECPVNRQCATAGRDEEYGVWAGVGARRRELARQGHEAT